MSSSVRNEQTDDESNFSRETQVPFEPVIRPPLRSIDKFAEPRIPHLSHRYTVAFMMFLGLFMIFGTRCNVGMTKIHLDKWVRILRVVHLRNAVKGGNRVEKSDCCVM